MLSILHLDVVYIDLQRCVPSTWFSLRENTLILLPTNLSGPGNINQKLIMRYLLLAKEVV